MLFLFSSICFIVPDFYKKAFSGVTNSSQYPFIIFPYLNRNTKELQIFNEFQRSQETLPIATATIDCFNSPTICSKFSLQPGFTFISYPAEKRTTIKIDRDFSFKSLKKLAHDIQNQNIMEIKSLDQIQFFSKESPLFLLVSRENAGDLEEKYPVFEQIAESLIGSDITFGFVVDRELYEKFAHYPLISFVYVPPTLQHVTFRGDFIYENLMDFISIHKNKIFSETFNDNCGISFVTVNDEIDEENYAQTKQLQGTLPLVFINSTKSRFLSLMLCGNSQKCNFLLDHKHIKGVLLDSEFDKNSVMEIVNNFDEVWKKSSQTNAILWRLQVYLLMNVRKCLCTFTCICAIFVFLVSFIVGQNIFDKKKKSKKN